MAPLVSVLLPTHNRASIVGLAIASVLQQTVGDLELLVVGDGCTDETASIVNGFGDPRIRWFDLPKGPGLGYANRNVALRQARGEFVAFAAHDDLMFPDHLELLLARIGKERDWVYSRPLWVSTDGVVVPFGSNLEIPDELTRFMIEGSAIPAICVLHRRSSLEAAGYWPEDVASAGDWTLWRRIIERCGAGRIGYLPTPTSLHFVADRKKSRYSLMPPMKTFRDIADGAEWWPPALKIPVQAGVEEQKIAFGEMVAGGAEWVAAVREGCRLTLDRIAWDAIRNLRPMNQKLRDEVRALEAEVAALRRDGGAAAPATGGRQGAFGAMLRRLRGDRKT